MIKGGVLALKTFIQIARMISSSSQDTEEIRRSAPAFKQSLLAMSASASASETLMSPVLAAPCAATPEQCLLAEIQAMQQRLDRQPQAYTCRINLKVAFFFDGTGNNIEADIGTDEHSNVARLFRAYPQDRIEQGIYAYYIPGLGTYFRKVGDVGDDDGGAFGKYGEERLIIAMKWLNETISKHSLNTIEAIEVSIFGFSRGAALARAFARRIAKKCSPNLSQPHKFLWPSAGKPFSISFLGLFDTVASVGLPASSGVNSALFAKRWRTLETALEYRRSDQGSGLAAQAFGGLPGADPTPGAADGHGAWASDLRVPEMVERTVHLVAMNEIRNSFPLDTVWNGRKLPDNAIEIVYPGAHSNVGGGYRPGEGGKSMTRGLLLSKVPLRRMYDEAVAVGVPMLSLDNALIKDDFSFDPELKERFDRTTVLAKPKSNRLGDALLSYNQLYLSWRFRKIRLALRAQDRAAIDAQEEKYRQEEEALNRRMKELENAPERKAAERDMRNRQAEWQRAVQRSAHFPHEKEEAAYMQAKARFDSINDAYLKERAKMRTLPDRGGELTANLERYDLQLLKDVAFLKAHKEASGAKLRPHYVELLSAYDREFGKNQGLVDPLVIDFFDSFVHDSLSGFAKDVTLPSDPRCCYIGGDDELKYANNRPVPGAGATRQA